MGDVQEKHADYPFLRVESLFHNDRSPPHPDFFEYFYIDKVSQTD